MKAMKLWMIPLTATVFAVGLGAMYLAGCSKSDANGTEDSSVSGAAAGVVGGMLGGTSGSGTMSLNEGRPASSHWVNGLLDIVPTAFASTACPTLVNNHSACTTDTHTGGVDLTYSDCSFGSSAATWSGVQNIITTGGTGVSCGGGFPSLSSLTQITRQVLTAANGTAGTLTRTSLFGTTWTLDQETANLGNYKSDTISTGQANGGYENTMTFSGGTRTGVTIAERLFRGPSSGPTVDHSITGTLTVSGNSTGATVTGTLTTYHNLVKVKGSTTFNGTTFSLDCCLPTGGTITTTFTSDSQSTRIGTLMNGKTETLTLTGTCGQATFTDYSGNTSTVTLGLCA